MRESRTITRLRQQFDANPGAFREYVAHEARIGPQRGNRIRRAQIHRGQPECEARSSPFRDVGARQSVRALDRIPTPVRDQLGQIAVTLAIGREQDKSGRIGQREFAAEYQRQPGVLRREMRANRARERAFVSQCKRRVTLALRALDQFLRVRRASQERKIGQAMKLGVGRQQVGRGHTS